jgi:hypothetical protein
MNGTVRGIISQCWSGPPSCRGSFEEILGLLHGSEFKITPAVDSVRVYEFLSEVGCNWEEKAGRRAMEKAVGPKRGRGAEGPPSPPDGAATPNRRIECPAFKTVMIKGCFWKKEPAMKKGKTSNILGTEVKIDVPDGIIAYLTRECGGNVHDHDLVEVTSGSFEKETEGANPHSGAYKNKDKYAAKNAVNLDCGSFFRSPYCWHSKGMGGTKNN